MTYVQDRLDQTITVDQMATEAGMSPSHFARVFKETLGSTPMQYVMAYRVEQAMKMMDDPARPLGDIAMACGFSDQAHFTRSFKQVVGQTPRAFRAANAV
nr:AraC family transcriptional regulator [Ruegeria sp. HKCCD6428]